MERLANRRAEPRHAANSAGDASPNLFPCSAGTRGPWRMSADIPSDSGQYGRADVRFLPLSRCGCRRIWGLLYGGSSLRGKRQPGMTRDSGRFVAIALSRSDPDEARTLRRSCQRVLCSCAKRVESAPLTNLEHSKGPAARLVRFARTLAVPARCYHMPFHVCPAPVAAFHGSADCRVDAVRDRCAPHGACTGGWSAAWSRRPPRCRCRPCARPQNEHVGQASVREIQALAAQGRTLDRLGASSSKREAPRGAETVGRNWLRQLTWRIRSTIRAQHSGCLLKAALFL
jgi:hypothetical protein